jgi:gliding motility-associated-like protein
MGGTPLSINSHTGLLTGKPNTIGQFVVGICVEEYRNGVLISTTRRDFQYNVGNCISLYSGVIEAPNIICSGLTVHFVNKSRGGGTHYAWNFGVSGTNRDTSTLFSPSYTFPDTGCYTIRLITEPNEPCHDTVYKRICLRTSSVYADFKLHYKNCNDTLRLQATDLSRDSVLHITSWYWNWGTGSSTQQNPTIILNNSGTYTVSLEVISANGCRHLYRKTFTVTKFNVQRDKTLYLCKGNQVNINPTGNPNFTYNWTPAATLNDGTNYNPKASPVATTTYKTVFSNYSLDTCSVTQHVTVNVSNDPPNFGIMATPSTTIYKGQTVNLAIQPTENNVTYTWLPNPLLQNTSANNQTVKPPQTTTFAVRGVRRPSGCMALDTIQIILKDVICGEPLIFLPNAFTPNGDGENDVLFLRSSVVADVYFAIYNRWGEKVFDTHDLATGWDGTYKGEALPPDVFGFYLKATCFDGAEFTKKGNITLIR